MDTTVTLTITPDPESDGAIAWHVERGTGVDAEEIESDGADEPEAGGYDTLNEWVGAAEFHAGLPLPVARAGLTWDDAEARPFGWSSGGGEHAPSGAVLTWTIA